MSHRKPTTGRFNDGRPHDRRKVDGKWLCRWCSSTCPSRRTSYCSKECWDETWFYIDAQTRRSRIYRRDKGVCATCGFDTNRIIRVRDKIRKIPDYARKDRKRRQFLELLKENGWGQLSLGRQPYEIDHIVPKILGGHDDLENLRTLCISCHKAETKRLARYRAHRRRKRTDLFEPHDFARVR